MSSETSSSATAWVCATCANQQAPGPEPPASCSICSDERQWVPRTGQRWTSLGQLRADGHRSDVREVEPGLLGIGADPPVAIGQRGLVVQTPDGNLLWDPPGYIDEDGIQAVRRVGGLTAVAASHPHFYGTIVDWAQAFDASILLTAADHQWLKRPDPRARLWSGGFTALPGVTLVQCGGHFDGSSVLHWADGAGGLGVLLAGDTIMVTPGQDRVTFLRSAPNRLPLPRSEVERILAAVAGLRYDRIYSGWWDLTVYQDAEAIVARSAARYIEWVTGEALSGPGRSSN